MQIAIGTNDIKILDYLYDEGFELQHKVFMTAAKEGNLDILDWLKKENCPYEFDELSNGNFNSFVKKWIKENITDIYKDDDLI